MSVTELVTTWRRRADEIAPFDASASKAFYVAADQLDEALQKPPPEAHVPAQRFDWRQALWTVDPETRMDLGEVLLALKKRRSWFYREAGTMPRRRCGTSPTAPLVFVAGEVRQWWMEQEALGAEDK